ncbi:MAG TPA: carboxylating nicotinate-nucleotide diphosphorylase [Gammaproteobacteria bacterium]|nr:carboxylating nicotinate-nucleotide diphosphorylase [Gammaproteobacteria bacterium]
MAVTGPGLPPGEEIRAAVSRALAEDIGPGDLTAALVPEAAPARASVICREEAVLCGAAWFEEVFTQLDPGVKIEWLRGDGEPMHDGQTVCRLQGPARALLSAERVALNFLQTLSGTATLARRYAAAVAGLPVELLDTRKTLPGMRDMQKYAVACGGCRNHRRGLYDGILIKENHIHVLGSVSGAIAAARRRYPDLPVEIEVETLDQLREAVAAPADIVLLDNFDLQTLGEAVALNGGRTVLEVSGGVNLDTVRDIAATGVDRISIGALTKDVRAVDFSMRMVFE